MRYVQATSLVEFKLHSWQWVNLYAAGGYQFQYTDYDILGYKGWQYIDDSPSDGQPELYLVYAGSSLKVLEYQITRHSPMAGILLNTQDTNPSISLAIIYQFLLISDSDDHILRSKLSTAKGIGHGLLCSIKSGYKFKQKIGLFYPSVFISADYSYIYADIDQTQKWYGDLDSVPEGTVYTGISHIIKSTLFSGTLGVKLSF